MSGSVVQLMAGATEADIQAALKTLPSGGTLVLPANAIIQVTKGIQIDGSRILTVDLNGSTLQQAGDVYVLSVNGRMTGTTNATLGHDGSGDLTVTYNGASKATAGDYVKIFSDDALPNDQGATTRLGQAMKVIAVNGNTLTLEGDLMNGDLYKTNVRAAQYIAGDVEVKNGTVRGDQKHADWQDPLVSARSSVGTHFDNVTVRDGNSMGFNFVSTVGGLVTQSAAINLKDDTEHGFYGYGVHSGGSLNTTVDGLYVERVRHGVDNNAVGLSASDTNSSKYGADIGLTATNVVANDTSSFAFSWHSEGRESSYSDSVVIDSFGVLGGRGTDNSMSDVSGSGNSRGILFFEYGEGDGQRITVDNVNLKETAGRVVYTQNGATANILSNSTLEVLTMANSPKFTAAEVAMTNTTLKVGAFTIDEKILGTASVDRLLGGSGVDTIDGGAGNDYIWGGAGSDILTGGAGSDRFAYLAVSEGVDTIIDFKAGAKGDVIDLSALSRSLNWKGDLFSGGYLRYVQSDADTLVQVDSNGGGNNFLTLATLKNVVASTLVKSNVSTELLVSDYTNHDATTADTGLPVTVPVTPTPAATAPIVTSPVVTTPAATTSGGSSPIIASSTVTVPVVNVPVISTPIVVAPEVPIPAITTPAVTIPTPSSVVTAPAAGTSASSPSTAPASTALKATDITAFKDLPTLNKILGTSSGETLNGTTRHDLVVGGGGDDTLNGGDGDDVLAGGAGADAMFGGAGSDTASYADATAAVIASLMKPAANTGWAAGDKYSQIEHLTGSIYNDALTGNDGVNTLSGGAGNDKLYGLGGTDELYGGAGDDVLDGGLRNDVLDGGVGKDRLIGGEGYDTLTGGAGRDVFVFDASIRDSFDTITDFEVGIDKIGLSATGLKTLANVSFEVSKTLTAMSDGPTLLYSATTGALVYDADGKGAGLGVKLGMIEDLPSLHLSDFVLI